MRQPYTSKDHLLAAVTAKIIAAAREVHQILGPGFEEVVYQRELARILPAHSLAFSREVWIDVCDKSANHKKTGRKQVDFVIGTPAQPQSILVEIKAKASLDEGYTVQTLAYPKTSGYAIGILINFGAASLEVRRLAD